MDENKHNIVFNITGNIFSLASNFLWLIALNRNFTIEISGYYLSALAFSAPLFVYANLDMRRLSSIDIEYKYSAYDYFTLRASTLFLAMLLSLFVIALLNDKYLIIAFSVVLSKFFESQSELAYGLYSRNQNQKKILISRAIKLILCLSGCSFLFFSQNNNIFIYSTLYLLSFIAPFLLFDIRSLRSFSKPKFRRLRKLFSVGNNLGLESLYVSLSSSLPLILITFFGSTTDVAMFGSITYLMTSIHFFFSSILYALLSRLKTQNNHNERKQTLLLVKTTLYTMFFGLVSGLPLLIFGETVLFYLYGWESGMVENANSIVYFRYVSIYFVISSMILSTTLLLNNESKIQKRIRFSKLFLLVLACFMVHVINLKLLFYISLLILIINIVESLIFVYFSLSNKNLIAN